MPPGPFFISKELSSVTQACNIIKAPETDHSAITDVLQPKGPGFWKFNNSLMDDDDCTSKTRVYLPLFKEKNAA